jgi:NodT family efflux transporter outer membrane factor (OMF) lipoprotein
MKKTQKMKKTKVMKKIIMLALAVSSLVACKSLNITPKKENRIIPEMFVSGTDTINSGLLNWRTYFNDVNLVALIDTAINNNPDLNIVMQEIAQSSNEILAKKGAYLPYAGIGAVGAVEKVSRYTSQGASDNMSFIAPGIATPEVLPNMAIGVYASWEVDIWKKLRNAKKSAYNRYLASIEGKNFLVTRLIAEVANNYYELLALDNELIIVNKNIQILSDALEIVRLQKEAARVTELAVRKFEAEVYHTRSLQFEIQQQIVLSENRINYLLGRYPKPIVRGAAVFTDFIFDPVLAGVPAQLLENRPDVRMAELELTASKLDIKVARAQFYPSLTLNAGIGGQSFNAAYLIKAPQSLLVSLAGSLAAPLINRKEIKANYFNANARQIQAVYNYQRIVLNAYLEVINQLSNIDNLTKRYDLQVQQVEALDQSILITNDLFTSARADYMEVLLTQRDALASKFELIETQKSRLNAHVNVYQVLGGGWK